MIVETLKKFAPFNELDETNLNEICSKAQLIDCEEGMIIFKRDGSNSSCHWLVSGGVDLLDKDFNVSHIDADSEQSKSMIDDNEPHELTAITTQDSTVLVLERSSFSPSGTVESDDTHDQGEAIDWMSALLESHLFELVPPSNIQELFNRFEEKKYEPGDKVIVQGELGDYFYVMQRGRARIDRIVGNKITTLAEVGPGSFFGEDALVREIPRNATITMLSPGTLMRLGKEDFQQLLQKPSNEYVTLEEVNEARASGEQKLIILDVRLPKEFQQGSVEKAINIPVQLLHQNLKKLRDNATYVCCCDGGHRSELAAYILSKGGFDAFILEQ